MTLRTDPPAGLESMTYQWAPQRESIAPGGAGNLLQLHQDFPNSWDAWDVDRYYRNRVENFTAAVLRSRWAPSGSNWRRSGEDGVRQPCPCRTT